MKPPAMLLPLILLAACHSRPAPAPRPTQRTTPAASRAAPASHVFGTYDFPGRKRRVVVSTFRVKSPASTATLARSATDMVIAELQRSGYFELLPAPLTRVRRTLADAIVVGTITRYAQNAREVSVELTLQVVDPRGERVLATERGRSSVPLRKQAPEALLMLTAVDSCIEGLIQTIGRIDVSDR